MGIARREVALLLLGIALTVGACTDEQPTDLPDPLLEGLEGHYRFEGDATDATDNGNHGTLLGGATAAGALATGSNEVDVLSLPASLIDGLTELSILGWVRLDPAHPHQNRQWISCAIAAEDNNLGVWYDMMDGRWEIDILGDRLAFPDDDAVEDFDWHQIAVVRSGATVTLYVDAFLIGSLSVSAAPLGVDTGGFMIGQDQDVLGGGFATENAFAGEVDGLRVYSRALTAPEIANINIIGVNATDR